MYTLNGFHVLRALADNHFALRRDHGSEEVTSDLVCDPAREGGERGRTGGRAFFSRVTANGDLRTSICKDSDARNLCRATEKEREKERKSLFHSLCSPGSDTEYQKIPVVISV